MRTLLAVVLAASSLATGTLAQTAPGTSTDGRPQWITAEAIEANLAEAMENPDARDAFLNSFLNGEVWVGVDQATLDAIAEQRRTGVQTNVPFRFFTGEVGGQEYIFAFTRPELAMAAFGREQPLLGMSGQAAFRAQNQVGLWLNFNNGSSVRFTAAEIAELLAQLRSVPMTDQPPAPVAE